MDEQNQNNNNIERMADRSRDFKRKGKGIRRITASYWKKKAVVITSIVIILITLLFSLFSSFVYTNQLDMAVKTAKTIYETLEVDSLIDFVEIKGDEEEGYYYEFVEDADEKIDLLVEKLNRDGNKRISKDLLEKMIIADVINQFPYLEGGRTLIGQGGSAALYTGSTTAEKIWNFLRGQGYSEYTVAGIMGNLMQESSFNPSNINPAGPYYGIAQWGGERFTALEHYAASVGKPWDDLDVQLDFLYAEMQTDGGGITTYQLEGQGYAAIEGVVYSADDIFNATSPQMASDAFQSRFERYGGEYSQRRAYAQQIYNTYAGTEVQKPVKNQNSKFSEVPHLYMSDHNIPLKKGGNVSSNGCGFVAIAMVLQYITGEEITVQEIVDWGQDKYYNGIGAEAALFEAAAENWDAGGVECVGKGATDEIKAALKENVPVIAYMGPGNFTTGGHFIVLTGIDENNQVTINDPGSRDRSNVKWDFDLIINEAHSGGAFWIFEAGESVAKGKFQGTIRIRRVTPNKNIGQIKNTGVRISSSNAVNGDGLGIKQSIPEDIRQQMEGVSMQHLSGITYEDLSYLTIPYYDFEGNVQQGHMIVNAQLADEVLLIFQELYNIKYPIERMELIDNFSGPNNLTGADLDYASIEANNTSAFNDRVTVDVNSVGTQPSLHATGQAIDINPQINPYITEDRTSAHPNAQKYNTNRDTKEGWTDVEKAACITMDSEIYKIFTKYGWKWLGNENNTGDTQHFYKDDLSDVATIDSNPVNNSESNQNAPHKVAIVAGHGTRSNAGTTEQVINREKYYETGTSGVTPSGETWNERDITKKVADYVEQYLSSYSSEVAVVQVGYSEPNWERMQLAKNEGVDSYVGIHFNSSDSTSVSGVSAYYRDGDSSSNSFADIIGRNVAENMGLQYRGTESDATSNKGILDSIGNSSEWGFPSTLIEGGFMSNPSDMEIIGAEDEEGLKRYAQGIASGILEYYGIENRGFDGTVTLGTADSTSDGINSRIFDLKYVSPEKFEEYVSNNSSQALNVFTLDEETKKLIVANWSFSTSGGLKITKSKPINFRSVVNKYTLPLEYQIDMLVHTDDPEMVGKLADLAINSEYIIAVQDNVTTIETTHDFQEKNYTRTLQIDEYVISDLVDWHTVSKEIEVEERVTNEIELTYADCWFVRFSKTSSYATSSFNQVSGNNLIADQGEYIGDFKTTVYCAGCNTPPGTPITASGKDATPNHTIAVHTEYFNGQAVGGKLANGSQVIINGTVYTVEDTGDLSRRWIDNWIDIYTETPCEEHLDLDSGNGTVQVYVAENVREATTETEGETEEEHDALYDNLRLKGLSTTANVTGKVTDNTTVVQETLPTEYDRISRTRTYVTENRKITTVRIITNKYDSGKEQVEGKEDEFIDVFLSSEGILRRFNINWMTSILEQSERTVNMIDLTKYLYEKALERGQETSDEDVEYSFDEYKYNDLYHIYASSDILEEYIKAQENNALRLYMNDHLSRDEGEVIDYIVPPSKEEDEIKYKLITNEEGGKGFGYNIFHYINDTDLNTGNGYEDRIVEHYNELGIDITQYVNADDTIDSSTVDEVMRMEIQKWKDKVTESLQNNGLELEENQINALTAVAYEYGWSEEDAASFTSAYNTYYINNENKEIFRNSFYIANHTIRPFYKSDIEPSTEFERKSQIKAELNWNLFNTGEYKTPDGEILDPDSFKGIISGDFLEVAQAVWQIICETNPEYSMAYGKMVPPSEGFTVTDCSHYVSWVLYEYGLATNNDELVKTFEGAQHSSSTLTSVNWDALGFEMISVSSMPGGLAANVQPGDILIKNGHTDIVVEYTDGTLWTYDCGNVYNWRGNPGEPVAKNYMLNQTHTVIRLKN